MPRIFRIQQFYSSHYYKCITNDKRQNNLFNAFISFLSLNYCFPIPFIFSSFLSFLPPFSLLKQLPYHYSSIHSTLLSPFFLSLIFLFDFLLYLIYPPSSSCLLNLSDYVMHNSLILISVECHYICFSKNTGQHVLLSAKINA
jgi:hypothetical protein